MFVKYIGTAGARTITKRQWEEEGVNGQDTVTWNQANGYSLPESSFTEDALAVLYRDPGLVIMGNPQDPEETLEARKAAAVRVMRARAELAATAS